MDLLILKSKIHNARLTDCRVDYEGSIEIDTDILDAVGLIPFEKVLVVNSTNGHRLETYAIPGEAGSRVFMLNGAAAHRGSPGDRVTIMSFAVFSEQEARGFLPKILIFDEKNEFRLKKIEKR